ncbi:MAG: hypothetical protein HYY54_02255 [candidate division NC10 bacterium]|nr:hypothetical protein [candidate division NC10 bacterium]
MARRDRGPGKATERQDTERQECPFLRRCAALGGYSLLGYCLAYRDGRLRAVTIAEFRDHCTGPGYQKCRTYQVRIAQEAANVA